MTSLPPTGWHSVTFNTALTSIIKSARKTGMAPGREADCIGKDNSNSETRLQCAGMCASKTGQQVSYGNILFHSLFTITNLLGNCNYAFQLIFLDSENFRVKLKNAT